MNTHTEYFKHLFNNDCSNNIISKIKNRDWEYILEELCSITDNSVIIKLMYIKHIATETTYSLIINYITNKIDNILLHYDKFSVHANLNQITLIDIDKHKVFIKYMSEHLKNKFPNKLNKCYLYNPPFVFSQIYNILSIFIDKETLQKIELIVNNK
jgi:hypothetical protein